MEMHKAVQEEERHMYQKINIKKNSSIDGNKEEILMEIRKV